MPTELLVATGAVIASFLSGLVGVGGGIVLAPFLLYVPAAVGVAAIPVKSVTGLTIVQALSASVIGTIRHHGYGNVSLRLVRVMGPAGALASLVGALTSRFAPDELIVGIFALFSLGAAAGLLLPQRGPARSGDADLDPVHAALLAIVIGFFGGIVGIGAIAFIIAALIYLMRVPVHVAIGTSLGVGLFSALAAFVGKAATAQIEPGLAVIVLAAALVASPIGAAIARRTHPRALQTILAVVVLLSGIRLAWHAITGS